MVHKRRREE